MFQDLTACVLVLNDEYFLPYALEASRNFFKRYVIYDVGSTDTTKEIIEWFVESNSEAEFFVRSFNEIPPKAVQGSFRNSMIAEAATPWYFILDGDEVYSDNSYKILTECWRYNRPNPDLGRLYGVVRRCEMNYDLTHQYNRHRTHHRIYAREAYFTGPHPGEAPAIEQKTSNEIDYPNVLCHHFHNTIRSSKENDALKRKERKGQRTYHPGELVPFNLLDEVPLLRNPVADFPVAPPLRKLQDEYKL